MKTTCDKTQKAAVTIDFITNEPRKLIAGGSVRESTLLDHAAWPAVARRERLTALLFTHCQSGRLEDYLQPEDEELLQRICQETITTGTHPVIRQKAIWALRFYPTPRSINVLADLAEFGEDEYIRSHAIASLAAMRLSLALPLFARKLCDHSDRVIDAAERAMRETVDVLGEEVLATVLASAESTQMRQRIQDIVQARPCHEREGRTASPRKVADRDAP
jgi:hypothetical protein